MVTISQRTKNVERVRSAKEEDIARARDGQCTLLCMDVQAVMLCPQLDVSSQYYKMKMQVHNFTIYNVISHDSVNYVWDEVNGEFVWSVFTTIIIYHLKQIYSDGCGYQNRNIVLSNAISNFAAEHNIQIEQKYLVKGHTQMECDSTHSLIERKIKNRIINLPSEFVTLFKEARKKPFPLDVKHLSFDFFKNFNETYLQRFSSIRPGKNVGDATVNNLRCLRYDSKGDIYYKLQFNEDYKHLSHRNTAKPCQELENLYNEPLTISETKFKHLQDLKSYIPQDTHYYYDNLKFHPDKNKNKKM